MKLLSFIAAFELIGTLAFAISGAMVAIEKKMDIFGVAILGLVTAVGGGIIRDIILGNIPPSAFVTAEYSVIAAATAILVFLPPVRKHILTQSTRFHAALLLMDTIGLSVFTVVGIQTAYVVCAEKNNYLFVFVGVMTGIGGGILRDLFAGNTPYVFVKHFYACASLAGAITCIGLWPLLGESVSMSVGAGTITVLRILAARFHWKLPKP